MSLCRQSLCIIDSFIYLYLHCEGQLHGQTPLAARAGGGFCQPLSQICVVCGPTPTWQLVGVPLSPPFCLCKRCSMQGWGYLWAPRSKGSPGTCQPCPGEPPGARLPMALVSQAVMQCMRYLVSLQPHTAPGRGSAGTKGQYPLCSGARRPGCSEHLIRDLNPNIPICSPLC